MPEKGGCMTIYLNKTLEKSIFWYYAQSIQFRKLRVWKKNVQNFIFSHYGAFLPLLSNSLWKISVQLTWYRCQFINFDERCSLHAPVYTQFTKKTAENSWKWADFMSFSTISDDVGLAKDQRRHLKQDKFYSKTPISVSQQ